jgi:hypothetical protein
MAKIEFDQSTRIPQLNRKCRKRGAILEQRWRLTAKFQGHFALSHVVAMRLNPALEAPLSDVYSEAETHRCGRVVPRVSVDPNCGIRGQSIVVPIENSQSKRQQCGDNRMQTESVPAPFHLCLGLRQLCFSRVDDAHGAGFVLRDLGQRVQGVDGEEVRRGFGKMHGNKGHPHGGPLG